MRRSINSDLIKARTVEELGVVRSRVMHETTAGAKRDELLSACDRQIWTAIATGRKAAEWVKLLHGIKDLHIRGKCASLVWWDYCPHSAALVKVMADYRHGEPDDPEAVFAGLRAVGYPEDQARRRCCQPKDSTYRPNAPLVTSGKGWRK